MIEIILAVLFIFCTVRQVISLLSMKRSRDFLASKTTPIMNESNSRIFIIIPVLHEQEILHKTVEHYQSFYKHRYAHVVFITTERENELKYTTAQQSSMDALKSLSGSYLFSHVHYPYSNGVKADQINYLVEHDNWSKVNKSTKNEDADDTFVLIYDADSRPDSRSIHAFRHSIDRYPTANVFQQVSWFRSPPKKDHRSWISRLFFEASALRANRFMLAYELPRLLGRLRYACGHRDCLSIISRYMFSHVTGHGLCVKKSFLVRYPFPKKTILEDMHYGFMLCCMKETVIPIRVLDSAEVPATLLDTFQQLTRWFLGPSRWLKYIISMKEYKSVYSWIMALSALYISIEWLLCSCLPTLLFLPFSDISFFVKAIIIAFTLTYICTCIYASLICSENHEEFSAKALLLYPIVAFLFGVAGFVGLWHLLCGENKLAGVKTRRC